MVFDELDDPRHVVAKSKTGLGQCVLETDHREVICRDVDVGGLTDRPGGHDGLGPEDVPTDLQRSQRSVDVSEQLSDGWRGHGRASGAWR